MPPQQRLNIYRYSKFNITALLNIAELLRGQPCHCDESQHPASGAFNWAIFLRFQDGEEWVFRSPHHNRFDSSSVASNVLASEVATMKLVRRNTSIPIPEVFDYCADEKNEVGVPYILMAKAQGVALATHDWEAKHTNTSLHKFHTQPRRTMNHENRAKVMRQLGYYSSQLSQVRFPTIGSLLESTDGSFSIQQCLSPMHLFEGRDGLEEIARGPFASSREFYTSLVAALRLHAEQLPMGYHLFVAPIPIRQEYNNLSGYLLATDIWNDFAVLGGKAESSENRLQYIIAAHFLRDSIIPLLTEEREEQGAGFPLCHPDLSDQNIFIDEEFNITCIIDWSFSSTVPPVQLYMVPGLPHARDLTNDPLLHDAFRTGFSCDAATAVWSEPLPHDWKLGAMVARLLRIVSLDSLQDYHHLEALCALCFNRTTFDLRNILIKRASTPEATELQQLLAADDEPEELTRRQETEYFRVVGPTRLAIARKLTFAYKTNNRFVADYRLWNWVGTVYSSLLGPYAREDSRRVELLLRSRNMTKT